MNDDTVLLALARIIMKQQMHRRLAFSSRLFKKNTPFSLTDLSSPSIRKRKKVTVLIIILYKTILHNTQCNTGHYLHMNSVLQT